MMLWAPPPPLTNFGMRSWRHNGEREGEGAAGQEESETAGRGGESDDLCLAGGQEARSASD